MFRKFFAAVILAVFMLNVQIVAAEDYDWSKAPRIGTKAQLARYIENERRKGNTKIHAVLTYFKFSSDKELAYKERRIFEEELINRIAIARARLAVVMGTGRLIYELVEYPGTRVANAYRDHLNYDDRAFNELEPEEKQLFYKAIKIVNEANKRNSEVEKARYIHDEIVSLAEYDYENQSSRNNTAIGALIDHYAQCQGYSDAFYMLGRMCGLNVCRIGGIVDGRSGHAWNFITFSDGKSYCVDVTMDDTYNYDRWFLATYEQMKSNYSCEWSIIPNLQ